MYRSGARLAIAWRSSRAGGLPATLSELGVPREICRGSRPTRPHSGPAPATHVPSMRRLRWRLRTGLSTLTGARGSGLGARGSGLGARGSGLGAGARGSGLGTRDSGLGTRDSELGLGVRARVTKNSAQAFSTHQRLLTEGPRPSGAARARPSSPHGCIERLDVSEFAEVAVKRAERHVSRVMRGASAS